MEPGHVAYSIAFQEEPHGKIVLARQFGKPTPSLSSLVRHAPQDGGHIRHRYYILRHYRNHMGEAVSERIGSWNPTTKIWEGGHAGTLGLLDMHPAAVKDRLYRCGLVKKELT